MEISAAAVKELREKTGAGFMDCKKALGETNGDIEKAVDYLKQKGLAAALKKSGRVTAEGLVSAYVHGNGKVGVLLEVNCETDFVAKTEEFAALVKDISMHIAAASPMFVSRTEVSADVIEREKQIFIEQAKESGKPEAVAQKMVEGKLDKFLKEICLLDQPFVKNPDVTVGKLIIDAVAKLGENISIRRFSRYKVGEGIDKKVVDFASEVAAAQKV